MLIEEYREGLGVPAVIDRCGVIAGPWQMGKVDQGVFTYWLLAHRLGRLSDDAGVTLGGTRLMDLPIAAVRRRVLVSEADPRLFTGVLRDELDPWADAARSVPEQFLRAKQRLESLVAELVSVVVPGLAESSHSSVALLLRMGFPEWTYWALPLVLHDFAHVWFEWGRLTPVQSDELRAAALEHVGPLRLRQFALDAHVGEVHRRVVRCGIATGRVKLPTCSAFAA